MLYGTGAASKTERWLNRDQSQHAAQYSMTGRRLGLGQSQQRFCTVSRFFQKSLISNLENLILVRQKAESHLHLQ